MYVCVCVCVVHGEEACYGKCASVGVFSNGTWLEYKGPNSDFYYYYCCCCCCCHCYEARGRRRSCLFVVVDNTFSPRYVLFRTTAYLPTYLPTYQAIVDAGMVFFLLSLLWLGSCGLTRRDAGGGVVVRCVDRAFFLELRRDRTLLYVGEEDRLCCLFVCMEWWFFNLGLVVSCSLGVFTQRPASRVQRPAPLVASGMPPPTTTVDIDKMQKTTNTKTGDAGKTK